MIQTEKIEYQKAYVELYEIIKVLPKQERDKIPNTFLKNLKDNMDTEYKFTFDTGKSILDQEYKVETKALFVELYERYLAPIEEKEFWNKYDKICFDMIEEEKQKEYNSENIFSNRNFVKEPVINEEKNNNNLPIEIQKENILIKFVKLIKKIFHVT